MECIGHQSRFIRPGRTVICPLGTDETTPMSASIHTALFLLQPDLPVFAVHLCNKVT